MDFVQPIKRLFFDYGVFSLKNASGKNLCRLKIQVWLKSALQIQLLSKKPYPQYPQLMIQKWMIYG